MEGGRKEGRKFYMTKEEAIKNSSGMSKKNYK